MRKVVLFIASSLDGYIARENGDIDWLPENVASGYDEFYKTIDTVVMGKQTYNQMLTFGAYPYQDKKSYVFTRNNNQTKNKNTEFVSDVDKFVKDIISNSGKNIWLVGGAEVISSFVNRRFVDEIILSIIPVILGKGIPLFKNIQIETKLELIETTNYEYLIELHYKVLN
jgi:dihydrofolate reductase